MVVAVCLEVLVSVGGFSVYRSYKGIVESLGNKHVQEGYATIIFSFFHGKLDGGFYRVDLWEELVLCSAFWMTKLSSIY